MLVVIATDRPDAVWCWSAGDLAGYERRVGGVQPAVIRVELDCCGVSCAQSEAGGGFPGLAEPSRRVEGVVCHGVAPVSEHPASGNRGELFGVTDGNETPPVHTNKVDELGEVRGGGHPGFVEDDRGARRPLRAAVSVTGEEPGERVSRTVRLGTQHVGGLA